MVIRQWKSRIQEARVPWGLSRHVSLMISMLVTFVGCAVRLETMVQQSDARVEVM